MVDNTGTRTWSAERDGPNVIPLGDISTLQLLLQGVSGVVRVYDNSKDDLRTAVGTGEGEDGVFRRRGQEKTLLSDLEVVTQGRVRIEGTLVDEAHPLSANYRREHPDDIMAIWDYDGVGPEQGMAELMKDALYSEAHPEAQRGLLLLTGYAERAAADPDIRALMWEHGMDLLPKKVSQLGLQLLVARAASQAFGGQQLAKAAIAKEEARRAALAAKGRKDPTVGDLVGYFQGEFPTEINWPHDDGGRNKRKRLMDVDPTMNDLTVRSQTSDPVLAEAFRGRLERVITGYATLLTPIVSRHYGRVHADVELSTQAPKGSRFSQKKGDLYTTITITKRQGIPGNIRPEYERLQGHWMQVLDAMGQDIPGIRVKMSPYQEEAEARAGVAGIGRRDAREAQFRLYVRHAHALQK